MYDIFRYNRTDKELKEHIRRDVMPFISQQHWSEVDICPYQCLCHNVSFEKILTLAIPFCDGSGRNDAVYVLECKSISEFPRRTAIEDLGLQQPRWAAAAKTAAESGKQLVYVGVSQSVVERIRQHVAARGTGANFTQIFPPVRLLNVEWYDNTFEARRAEEITAEVLREELSEAFVYQPG